MKLKLVVGILIGLYVMLFGSLSAQAIINGTPAKPELTGMVDVTNLTDGFTHMSGTVLTNEWVLTTGHGRLQIANPNNVFVWKNNEIYNTQFVIGHPSLDFALIKLSSPIIMNGSTSGYQRGLYTATTEQLINNHQPLACFGYGPYNEKGDTAGLHQGNFLPNGVYDNYNFQTAGQNGVYTGFGDSGGSCLTTGVAGGVVTGILKGGGNWARPENFRSWILSHIYNKPVDLPEIWFAYTTPHHQFWDKPLQNNFTNEWTWSPCAPGTPYTWTSTYDLETNYDYVHVRSADGAATVLNGWNGSASGSGSGPLTLKVVTDGSVQSPGIITMPIQCQAPAEPWKSWEYKKWEYPLPLNYTSSTTWLPCPNGGPFDWQANYGFRPSDTGKISFTGLNGATVITVPTLSPTSTPSSTPSMLFGMISGTVNNGPITVEVNTTDPNNFSLGFNSFATQCSATVAIKCHGPTCLTTPALLPKNQRASAWWNPCQSGQFTWTAEYDFGQNDSLANIYDQNLGFLARLSGNGSIGPFEASGSLYLEVETDGNTPISGLKNLNAVCAGW